MGDHLGPYESPDAQAQWNLGPGENRVGVGVESRLPLGAERVEFEVTEGKSGVEVVSGPPSQKLGVLYRLGRESRKQGATWMVSVPVSVPAAHAPKPSRPPPRGSSDVSERCGGLLLWL